ncbi:hypothetical protein V8G54_034746 [Vigna mungo]|uniref:Uncharacterized protein n=1 Tax=Vigna mungo TaxID=3915 RepID=A0AAQ3RDT4_VIGMU
MAPPLKPNQIPMPQAPNDRQLRQKFILPLTTMAAPLHRNSVPVFSQNPLIHSPKRTMTNDPIRIETLCSRLQLLVGKLLRHFNDLRTKRIKLVNTLNLLRVKPNQCTGKNSQNKSPGTNNTSNRS